MRKIPLLLALVSLAVPALAREWARRAPMSEVVLERAVAAAALAETGGPRPVVLLETNYYTFLPGEPLQLRVTVQPNGFGAPVTMYLYRENRVTGERRYHNIAGGLLAGGQQADLFGTTSAPVPVFTPTMNDFVLFGSASDASPLSWGVDGALGGSTIAPANETGLYQWVIELRDAAGKRVLSRANAMYSYITESVNVGGTITASTTWSADRRYVLNNFVGVAAPATLTIEPGTVIYGSGTTATLFIQRGAKIVADGTARRPIVFTSPQRVGNRAQRDWGSLVLLGAAPINVGETTLEGLPSEPAYRYGGTEPADSSGIVRYVRLEFGGYEISTGQEINGLTLAGVGSGTVVDYVEVLHNKDDAFEFFGGTVNAKHLLGVAFADDGLDFDNGYSGNIQFAVLIKRASNDEDDGNVLTESDNHPQTFTVTPQTNPRVYNVTAIRESGPRGNYGAVLRRGSAGKFYNTVVAGSRRAPVTLRDDATFNAASAGELAFNHSLLFGNFADSGFGSSDRATQTRDFLFTAMTRNRNGDPMLAIGDPSLIDTYMPDLMPLDGSPALDADFVANPPDDGFFDAVDFIGAVGPGHDWVLSGWANFSDN